jgi:hypothetical protein
VRHHQDVGPDQVQAERHIGQLHRGGGIRRRRLPHRQRRHDARARCGGRPAA